MYGRPQGDRRMATKTAPKPTETEPQRRATQEPAPGARGVSSPIQRLPRRASREVRGVDDGQVATYIPELAQGQPELVRHLRRDRRRPRLRGRATRAAVHDPVDLEAVRLRPGARGSRARTPCSSGSASSRRATRSTRSACEPGTGRPLNPMINAGAIADDVAGRRRDERRDSCERLLDGDLAPTRAARSTIDETVYQSEKRDRPPQPRHRPHAAQLRHPRPRIRRGARRLLPAVLDPGRPAAISR